MWLLLPLLALCSAHLAPGTETIRSDSIIKIEDINGTKILSKVHPISGHEPLKTLDLSGLNLNTIEPTAFDDLQSLESLNLNNNKLQSFPSSIFSKLSNLKHLSLIHNNFAKLGESFTGLDNLEKLDLSHNQIQNISGTELSHLPKSADLIVTGNRILEYSNNLRSDCSSEPERGFWTPGRVANWRRVPEDYKYNKDVNITKLLADRPRSVKLCKNADNIVEAVKRATRAVPLKNCKYVRLDSRLPFVLPLNRLGIKGFARGWYQISEPFFKIDLSGNDITEITPEILNDLPSHVTTVDLSRNRIPVVRNNVIENRFLKSLMLNHIGASKIEDGAFEKTELDALHFKNSYAFENLNFIKRLPANLTELVLGCRHRYAVDEDLLSNLKALKVLTMDSCFDGNLPGNFFRGLRDLEEIYLMRNNFNEVELGTFDDNEKLQWIFFSENNLKSLPSGLFRNIKGLNLTLDLTRNKFSRISKDMFEEFKGKPMKSLWLHENKINFVEDGSFSNMKMEELNLGKNRLRSDSIGKGAFESSRILTLFLGGNGISRDGSIDGELFSGLKVDYLGLGGSRMKIIDTSAFGNICKVRLNGNRIERIRGGRSL